MTQRIAEKSVGTQTVRNTDFAVVAFVERGQFGSQSTPCR